jgi:hypothetical protein
MSGASFRTKSGFTRYTLQTRKMSVTVFSSPTSVQKTSPGHSSFIALNNLCLMLPDATFVSNCLLFTLQGTSCKMFLSRYYLFCLHVSLKRFAASVPDIGLIFCAGLCATIPSALTIILIIFALNEHYALWKLSTLTGREAVLYCSPCFSSLYNCDERLTRHLPTLSPLQHRQAIP